MIAAGTDFAALAARLTRRAGALAVARLRMRGLGSDESRRRRAGLLWPLFTKG